LAVAPALGRGLAYVPQGREIFSELTSRISRQRRGRMAPSVRRFWTRPSRCFPVLKQIGGDPVAHCPADSSSSSRSRALGYGASLLILDEPTEGIQPNLVAAIKDVLAAFKGRISLLLVEQYLDFAVSLGRFIRRAVAWHGRGGRAHGAVEP